MCVWAGTRKHFSICLFIPIRTSLFSAKTVIIHHNQAVYSEVKFRFSCTRLMGCWAKREMHGGNTQHFRNMLCKMLLCLTKCCCVLWDVVFSEMLLCSLRCCVFWNVVVFSKMLFCFWNVVFSEMLLCFLKCCFVSEMLCFLKCCCVSEMLLCCLKCCVFWNVVFLKCCSVFWNVVVFLKCCSVFWNVVMFSEMLLCFWNIVFSEMVFLFLSKMFSIVSCFSLFVASSEKSCYLKSWCVLTLRGHPR